MRLETEAGAGTILLILVSLVVELRFVLEGNGESLKSLRVRRQGQFYALEYPFCI